MSIIARRTLGASGLSINPVGFGTWPLSKPGRPSESEAIKVVLAALDAGINFLDTADVYGLDEKDSGYSEKMIAKVLRMRKKSESVIIATKGGHTRPNGEWGANGTREHLIKACESSLRALEVECIDLYQLHTPDRTVPWQESIEALGYLKRIGKIQHIGLSNVSLVEIEEARKIVEIVTVQNQCNPFDLSSFHKGIIAYCEKNNIAFLGYCPVGGAENNYLTAQNRTLLKIGSEIKATPYQVALAWLLASSPILIPIPGATKIENAIASAKAMEISLGSEQMLELDVAFKNGKYDGS